MLKKAWVKCCILYSWLIMTTTHLWNLSGQTNRRVGSGCGGQVQPGRVRHGIRRCRLLSRALQVRLEVGNSIHFAQHGGSLRIRAQPSLFQGWHGCFPQVWTLAQLFFCLSFSFYKLQYALISATPGAICWVVVNRLKLIMLKMANVVD